MNKNIKYINLLVVLSVALALLISCKHVKKEPINNAPVLKKNIITHAKGFRIEKTSSGFTIIKITSPWLNSETILTYALVPKEKAPYLTLDKQAYDAIVTVPVERIVVTSTTHIPALEALGVADKLVGFPNTSFISSKNTRKRIDKGLVKDLGNNESINTEITISLKPDVVVGFGINNLNKAYETIQSSKIPVLYNGDWTEETPLGKAEWIKFFAPFFKAEKKADSIFNTIKESYEHTKSLAQNASNKPTVLSGGLYKDVWYMASGDSWMAQFLEDAHTDYLWKETKGSGSLPLSLESVFVKGRSAEFWLNPSNHASLKEMNETNRHYQEFDAFKNKTVYSHVNSKGATGGLLFFELAPNRPDLVLKDLIHVFHPELLPNHKPFFYNPLK